MSGGGKTSKQEATINEDLRSAALPLIEQSRQVAQLPYTPNRGIQFAAFTPMQMDAFAGTNAAASAYGLPNSPYNMPAPEVGPTGIPGYSTGAQYDANVAASVSPEMQSQIAAFFGGGGAGGGLPAPSAPAGVPNQFGYIPSETYSPFGGNNGGGQDPFSTRDTRSAGFRTDKPGQGGLY